MSDLIKPEILTAFTEEQLPRLLDILNQYRRKLEEGNLFEYWQVVDVTTPATPNTEFRVDCTPLNRTPVYYRILKKDRAVDVYTGTTAWSKNTMYLKATVANAVIKLAAVA